MKTLSDLGERKIISEIVSKYCSIGKGDDCAVIERPSEQLIVTTDPVPPPAAEVIAGNSDPYWKGWLLTVINASDLAAAAATPASFFVAAEAPSSMKVTDFERFLEGVKDSCDAEGLVYSGGNLREGKTLQAVGTAIGYRGNDISLGRSGAKDGDYIVVVGEGGKFWLDAMLSLRKGKHIDKNTSPLFSPRSESKSMRALASHGLLSSSIDNSDGLFPSIEQLCAVNKIGAEIDLKLLNAPSGFEVGMLDGINHERLWLGWGDWNVVVSVRQTNIVSFKKVCATENITCSIIGRFDSSLFGLILKSGQERLAAPRIDSERFAKDSWFSSGIDGYIQMLLTAKLPGSV